MTDCQRQRRRFHEARVGERMKVTRIETGRTVLIGDKGEIACIPHEGCRLRVWSAAVSQNQNAAKLLPLDEILYTQVRFFMLFRRDLFLLPNGRQVKLQDLNGFELELLPESASDLPREEEIVATIGRERAPESVCVN